MRKRKILCKSIILIVFQIFLCVLNVGSTKQRIKVEEMPRIINIYEDTEIYIEVSEKDDDMEVFLEAEQKVVEYLKKYDVEYAKPKKVVFGDIIPEYIYGCENDAIIYLDNERNKAEMLATLVHELLHLQNPVGFDSKTEFGTIGHNLTEAVVEKMTIEITNESDTKRTQLLNKWTSECIFQMLCKSFFNQNSNEFDNFLNDEQLHKVVYQEKEYLVSTSEYFKISFDKWMIVEDAEKNFGKLKTQREP